VAAPEVLTAETIRVAEESLRRCASEAFFQAFYKRLLSLDAATRAKFAKTDFDRQNKLLQHGLGLLFTFAKRRNPALLERIATRHARHDLDVPPQDYAHFTESLLLTVREFDPEHSAEVEEAWRRAIAPGIACMKAQYVAANGDGAAGGKGR
jgi:hemoglobin-like flavoprotein